jgi:mRNA interferase RelE/StbE
MRIEITRKFQKQVEACKDGAIRTKVLHVISEVISAEAIGQISNIKKLTGYKNMYRIRIGSYRVGISIDQNTVTFAAFKHRSAIYKSFP